MNQTVRFKKPVLFTPVTLTSPIGGVAQCNPLSSQSINSAVNVETDLTGQIISMNLGGGLVEIRINPAQGSGASSIVYSGGGWEIRLKRSIDGGSSYDTVQAVKFDNGTGVGSSVYSTAPLCLSFISAQDAASSVKYKIVACRTTSGDNTSLTINNVFTIGKEL